MSDGVDPDKRATLRRFAALGAATSLTGLLEPTSGDSEVREAILGYLAATPGAHFSKLRDDLGLGTGEAQHHLKRLLKAEAVETYRDGDYRRFYLAGRYSPVEKVTLGYLRRETARGMVIELLRNPEASPSELAETLDVSRPTISKRAADLAQAGLLDRDDGYELVHPETTLVLLLRHADSFDENAEAFAADAADLVSVE